MDKTDTVAVIMRIIRKNFGMLACKLPTQKSALDIYDYVEKELILSKKKEVSRGNKDKKKKRAHKAGYHGRTAAKQHDNNAGKDGAEARADWEGARNRPRGTGGEGR